jgi:hypothetical protein
VEGHTWSLVSQLESELLAARAVRVEKELEAAGNAAVRHLLVLLRSPNPAMRANAAEMLGVIGSSRATSDLVKTLDEDKVVEVRRAAAFALGELKDSHAVNALERAAAADRSHIVRVTAGEALANLAGHWAGAAGKTGESVPVLAVAPGHPNWVYVAALNQLSVSRDGGATWTSVEAPLPSHVSAMAINPTDPHVIYAGVDSSGIYKSTDAGATWFAVNTGLGLAPGVRLRVTALAIHPENAEHLFAARGVWIGTSRVELVPLSLMESRDSGGTWFAIDVPEFDQAIGHLVVTNNKLYAAAGERIISVDLPFEDEL